MVHRAVVVFVKLAKLKFFDVCDRKYLQYVADDIADWLREEELKSELAGSEELAQGTKRAMSLFTC